MLVAGDVLTDADLAVLDSRLDDDFGSDSTSLLAEKRRVAVTDWLSPRLETAGYQPARHRTRQQPTAARGWTAGVWADLTARFGNAADADVDLAAVLATPAADAVFIGHRVPYQGLFVVVPGAGNANASTMAVSVWNGNAWVAASGLSDDTVAVTGKTLSGGGRVAWTLPDDWATRAIDGATAYWSRVTVSSALSTVSVSQVLPIVRSRLAWPVGLYVLSLVYQTGASGRRGAWLEQADSYAKQAQASLEVALPLVGDEFDLDDDDAVGPTEQALVGTAPGAWSLERG